MNGVAKRNDDRCSAQNHATGFSGQEPEEREWIEDRSRITEIRIVDGHVADPGGFEPQAFCKKDPPGHTADVRHAKRTPVGCSLLPPAGRPVVVEGQFDAECHP